METVNDEPNQEETNAEMDVHFNKLMELLSTSEFLASTLKLQLDEVRRSSARNVSTSTINDEVSSNGNKKLKRKILSEIFHSPCVKKTKLDAQVSTKANQNANSCDSKCRVSDKQPILFEGGVLRNYQLEGLTWLQTMYKNALNGILADEMGLGKTLQVIAFICHLIEKKIVGPYLIIAPLSTLPNWMSEFHKFAPKVPILLMHGTKRRRYSIFKKVHSLQTINETMKAYPVLLTSFEVPMLNKILFRKTKWHYLIIDEGHRLKNNDSQLSRELKSYITANRLLLTGTPLQNNLAELWSLLNFILPEVFNDLSVFEDWFKISDLEDAENHEQFIRQEQKTKVLNAMHKILDTFLLRRVKEEVELNLPPKKEILVYCKMSEQQLCLYHSTVDRTINRLVSKLRCEKEAFDGCKESEKRSCSINKSYKIYFSDFENLSDDEVPETISTPQGSTGDCYKVSLKMQNPMMQLRKIVNHPYLVQMPLDENRKMMIVDEELVTQSGKLLVLDALLVKLKEQGHKVLIFSTFTSMLDILEDYLLMRNYKYSRLDGQNSFLERAERIKYFNTDSDVFAFLISTRSGSLGLNLTSADTVIIYDSDWNPQVDLQAQDRCHRIGQTKPVLVYRLIGQGTIDEKIVRRAAAKRKLEKLVLLEGKFNKASKLESVLDLKELKKMLETTDHCTKVHSNGFVLTDKELQKMLDRGE